MRTEEEEESAPRKSSGADKKKAAPRKHNHIGPNVRAFRAGLAFCPSCDADKVLRLTEAERDSERAARENARKK